MRWWIGALTLLVACSGDDEATDSRLDDILALSGDTAAGQTSYDANCTVCLPPRWGWSPLRRLSAAADRYGTWRAALVPGSANG